MKELTTHSQDNDAHAEDEITLVDHGKPGAEGFDDEGSITLKIRNVRKTDHVNVTRRLQDIERRVKKDLTWKLRVIGIFEALEQVLVWLDAWGRRFFYQRLGSKLPSLKLKQVFLREQAPEIVTGRHMPVQKKRAARSVQTHQRAQVFIRRKAPRFFRPSFMITVLLILCVIISGIVIFSHREAHNKTKNTAALETEGLRNVRLSSLLLTDTGRNVLNSRKLPVGRPFYAEFDVLDWNEQPGQALDLSVDVRVFSQKGKIELFRPEVVKFAQVTNKQIEKVHVKVFFNFSNETPAGDYRLSFSVTEAATQRRAMMETRIFVK